jgi:hypothetical protein
MLDSHGLDPDKIIAGVFGGATHIALDKWAGWWSAICSLMLGVSAANYLGEVPYNYGITIFGKLGSVYLVGAFAGLILRIIGSQVEHWQFLRSQKKGGPDV